MDVYNLPLPGLEELAPGVWRYCGEEEKAPFAGSIHSSKFHRPDCWHGRQILPTNRVCFQDGAAAGNYGYTPCAKCKPLEEKPDTVVGDRSA